MSQSYMCQFYSLNLCISDDMYYILLFRTNAKTGVEKSRKDLYQSIAVLFVVFLITPIIIYTNSKMAISGEVRKFFA